MSVYCSVPECTTKGTNGMHRFPADPQQKQKWMHATKTHHLADSKNCRICRKHFKESDLMEDMNEKKTLAPNAVPSLFLPLSLNWDHGYHVVCCEHRILHTEICDFVTFDNIHRLDLQKSAV